MGLAIVRRFAVSSLGAAVVAVATVKLWLVGSASDWLYVLGGTEECAGVALVAAPELFPRLRESSDWLNRSSRAAQARARSWLRKWSKRKLLPPAKRPGRSVSSAVSLAVDAEKGFPEDAEPDVRIRFLEKVVKEHDWRLANLDDRLKLMETQLRTEIAETKFELDQRMSELLEREAETYLDWRYAGLALLFVGLALSTAGNLVK
jgi:hypothetical protein